MERIALVLIRFLLRFTPNHFIRRKRIEVPEHTNGGRRDKIRLKERVEEVVGIVPPPAGGTD